MDITSNPRYKSAVSNFSKDLFELTRKIILEELRAAIHAGDYSRLSTPARKPIKRLAAPKKRLHLRSAQKLLGQ